jgi:hypothetical protein
MPLPVVVLEKILPELELVVSLEDKQLTFLHSEESTKPFTLLPKVAESLDLEALKP